MDRSDNKQWSKRYNWAQCFEPYKTQLDAIGSQWIEGALSNEELAFEAVQMLSEMDWMRLPSDSVITNQVKVLTEAMLAVSERPQEMQTPDARRYAIDNMREALAMKEGPWR
jgi:hypothetical protein